MRTAVPIQLTVFAVESNPFSIACIGAKAKVTLTDRQTESRTNPGRVSARTALFVRRFYPNVEMDSATTATLTVFEDGPVWREVPCGCC